MLETFASSSNDQIGPITTEIKSIEIDWSFNSFNYWMTWSI